MKNAILIVVCVVLAGLFVYEIIPPPYVPKRGLVCTNNLRNLAFALQLYAAKKDRLPPRVATDATGQPLHSWRTLLLPILEREELYRQLRLDEPWNSPHNAKLLRKRPDFFHCPSDDKAGDSDTSYVAIFNAGTIWDSNWKDGLNTKDPAAQTILLVELKNSGIHWAEPRDLDLNNLPPGITKDNLLQSLSNHPAGFVVAFAGGNIRFISTTIPWATFEAHLTVAGREKLGEEDL